MFTIYLLIVALIIVISLLYFSYIETLAKKILGMVNTYADQWKVAVVSLALLLLGVVALSFVPGVRTMVIGSLAGIIASYAIPEKYMYKFTYWMLITLNYLLGGVL